MTAVLEPRLPPYAREVISAFLQEHVTAAHAQGCVVGLSGGIDSALVARLAADALGPQRVTGLSLPDARAPAALRKEIAEYATSLGIRFRELPITPIEDAFDQALGSPGDDMVARGNRKARIRMALLYETAHKERLLVTGTGNKSELLLGYFTKYGDGGVDLLPLGDLYKTSIFALGRELGLPKSILDAPPTAGLWEGQTDEQELGFTYAFADRVLLGLERLLHPEEIAEKLGVPLPEVEAVSRRVETFRHKRRPPPIPKLSQRTIGVDWRD
ncbi:MAG: NAD+ synthase [Candidatus Thermoplasmatota archaeon]|jgi:NAD+ synthase|nr:NAD+ synthase [Candidatus Thermoplasmatota archaeon]MCL5984881.1 NAD+ synthase [Candidatus Thermoplasmatota archaeon]